MTWENMNWASLLDYGAIGLMAIIIIVTARAIRQGDPSDNKKAVLIRFMTICGLFAITAIIGEIVLKITLNDPEHSISIRVQPQDLEVAGNRIPEPAIFLSGRKIDRSEPVVIRQDGTLEIDVSSAVPVFQDLEVALEEQAQSLKVAEARNETLEQTVEQQSASLAEARNVLQTLESDIRVLSTNPRFEVPERIDTDIRRLERLIAPQ